MSEILWQQIALADLQHMSLAPGVAILTEEHERILDD
jgi:hypothetical protein